MYGCKKYPDGPAISLRSKTSRISGEWDVEYFSINGYDSTSYLKSLPFYGKYYISAEQVDHNSLYRYINTIEGGPAPTHNGLGYWMYLDDHESVYFYIKNYSLSSQSSLGPYRAESVVWKIRRLKNKELWLTTTYNGKEYFVKFKQ